MNEILIKTNKVKTPLNVGQSKLWGFPDLPDSINYPIGVDEMGNAFPLNFVCQINCKEIHPYDIDKKLPEKGILYFFADIDYYLGFYDCPPAGGIGLWPKNAINVFYFPGNENELIPLLIEKKDVEFFIDERRITFEASSKEKNQGIKILGDPFYMEKEELGKQFKNVELLFQLDSEEDDDFSLNFMDVGLLYFFIEKKDLIKRNFDNVFAYMMSS